MNDHDTTHGTHADTNADSDNPTMGNDPGEQGDFASGQDSEGQDAEQAIDHDAELEQQTDHEVDPSTEREQPTPKDGDHDGDGHEDDDAHANEPRTDAAAPPAQGPAA